MARQNELNEMKYINAWVKEFHPRSHQYPRMRVGPLPEGDVLLGVMRVFPDKILIEDKVVLIVEGKLAPDSRAIGQLELYAELFPKTPEFDFAADLPIRKILLTTRDDPTLRPFAESRGIEYVIYLPEWVKIILDERAREREE